uniref:RNA polymerase alpha subunit n=1 Tax=Ochrosphaera neapolitana TaxID=35137 RepID=UPI00286A81EC|nr:RNA polymerase alpha subunit [Ochrosphaera neapolitana]WKK50119.1 RNA polymerase alpha subunit [Ochrosphaera neapolitana]
MLVQCLESVNTKPTELFSRFRIEPLLKGQGTTVGNALRRTLLSSIPGISVVGVRISGINHEFSAIPGVKEDVLEILLNLKQLVFMGDCSETVVARLNFKGPGIVTAANIELSSNLRFVNKRHFIATVDTFTTLEMELLINKGEGYSLNNNELLITPKGFLTVDAVFMPVKKVNFFIEVYQDSKLSDQETLIVEIQTNGSVTPIEALNKGASQLASTFSSIRIEDPSFSKPILREDIVYTENQADINNTLIEELELSVRAYNCLKRANIHTLGDLLKYSQNDLLEFKNFGQKSAGEVCNNLHKRFNLNLK